MLSRASKPGFRPEKPSAERSRVMRAVKGSDTGPELKIRKMLHRRGLRFRLSGCGLPGKPDIVLPRWRTAIFVHGCFWHGHDCARGARIPKANREYWTGKIRRNMARDERVRKELSELGWRVLVIWECEIREVAALENRFAEAFHKEPTAHARQAAVTRA